MNRKKVIRSLCLMGIVLTSSCKGYDETSIQNLSVESSAISADFTKKSAYEAMKKVADWQLLSFNEKNNLFEGYDKSAHMSATSGDSHPLGWVYAAYHVGMSRWAALADNQGDSKYYQMQYNSAKQQKYVFGPRIYNADDYAIGQLYLDLYSKYQEPEILTPLKAIFEIILQNPSTLSLEFVKPKVAISSNYRHMGYGVVPAKDRWSWADALFMGPPVWIELSKITGDPRYLEFADKEFWATVDLLWDEEDHLFFRDSRFFNKRENNGEKVIWARGVGWVAAGLARMLENIPLEHHNRAKYEDLFRKLMTRLAAAQQSDGLWRPSVLDPKSQPYKETSGTALMAFAFASGINQGVLKKETFLPTVRKAWTALVDAVQPDGKLGWVQQIGHAPDSVSADDTQIYAVGAYLLVGTEVYKLSTH